MEPKRLVDVYSDRKYFCKVCNLIVGSTVVQHHRVPHMTTMKSTVRKMYKCKICSEIVIKNNLFHLHLKKEHSDLKKDRQLKADALKNATTVFHCSLCDLYLTSNRSADWHRKPHIKKLKVVPQNRYQDRRSGIILFFLCKQCPTSRWTRMEFHEHYSQMHSELCQGGKKIDVYEAATPMCRCHGCSLDFEESRKQDHLKYHQNLARRKRKPHIKKTEEVPPQNQYQKPRITLSYRCRRCTTSCHTPLEFRNHYRQMHITLPRKYKTRSYKIDVKKDSTPMGHCHDCSCDFEAIKKRAHQKYHQDMAEKMQSKCSKKCSLCDKVLTNRYEWETHISAHKNEKQRKKEEEFSKSARQCKLCQKEFDNIRYLKHHMERHSQDRPHVCEICGNSFKSSTSLNRHRNTHSDVKRLICEYCGKGFTERYNLKGHLRTHTGDKPFKCDVCDAAFTHNVSLKTHKKSAHGIDMWKEQKPQKLEEFPDSRMKQEKRKVAQAQQRMLQSMLSKEEKKLK